MKIKLEFEKDDFHSMLKTYFSETGWEALNLTDVVDQFETAFPGGIVVEAVPHTPSKVPAAPDEVSVTVKIEEDQLVVQEIPNTSDTSDTSDNNPTLGFSELMGPSEVDDDTTKEIGHILKKSEDLK